MQQMDINAAEEAVGRFLEAMRVDEGDHTAGTPGRVARAWAERLEGYNTDPADHLNTTFSAPPNPGLVIVRNVRIQSTCAHHLLPIEGTATIAYRPTQGSRVVGLSKLTRLAEGYARRLQVQENITAQIVEAINDRLKPEWVGCAITATHGCMTIRGVRDECSDTVTFNEAGQPRTIDHQAFWAAHNQAN